MAYEIQGKTILVTGGAGMVGSHIVDELINEGAAKVIVLDSMVRGRPEHLRQAQERGNVKIVVGDVQDTLSLRRAMEGVDYVSHQASMWLRRSQEQPRLAIEVNVMGTYNVLEACVNAGIKKIVYASSSSVYGDGSYLPTDENHPFNNDLFYGATKIAAEQLCRCFHKEFGLPYSGTRYLNVYGPRQPFQAAYMDVIMHFINRLDQGKPPIIHGDGSQTVDLIYVKDTARLNILCIRKEEADGQFFNGASGQETSLTELAHILIRLMGYEGKLEPEYIHRDSRLVSRRWGCTKKAQELLGFKAATSVEEGMREVIKWREAVKRGEA
ncbi:MAG: SDR family NAD(P)-dependent oxidoreductase [Deltaproteobacteria bacterium]|nr:SDR family NAD(P)-dependent oxidoreductase [Deltaproteobacteria bacterium]